MLEVEIERLPSFLMGEERGIKKGVEKGVYDKAIAIAKQLFNLSLSLTEIAKITGLTTDELEQLQADK
jgi:predicted transposase/invertase (TIGR01784 family)